MVFWMKKNLLRASIGLLGILGACQSYQPEPSLSIRQTPRFIFKELFLGVDTTPIPLPQYTGAANTLIVTQPRKGIVARRFNSYQRESIPCYIPPVSYRAIPDIRQYEPYDTIPFRLIWDSAGIPMELNSQLIVNARPSL